jgi:hypothetical protein
MSRVVHFEIHATDPAQVAKFYTDLFGWTITKWEGPVDYWIIKTGPAEEPGIDGGITKRRGDNPASGQPVNSYVCTIGVESAQGSLDKAVSLGAEIALPVMPIPGVGYLAYAKDTDGNIFGMMQSDPSATFPG